MAAGLMRRTGLILAALVAAAAAAAPASAGSSAQSARVLLAFLPAHEAPPYTIQSPLLAAQPSPSDAVLARIASHAELSVGLVSATQGTYDPHQAVLDMSQGTRVSQSTYDPSQVPVLLVHRRGTAGQVIDWPGVLARAGKAPQTIDPGLLAGSIPGGAAYVGVSHTTHIDAVVAAGRSGRIARMAVGPAESVAPVAQALLARYRLVVADLPPDAAGARALDQLLAQRGPAELVIVMQRPPNPGGHQFLPMGMAAGLPAHALTSPTTTLPGIVAGIDIAPTVLEHLGIAVPSDMRGQAIRAEGDRNPDGLRAFAKRTSQLSSRRSPAIQTLLLACFALTMILGALQGWERGRRRALRISGLAFLWLPLMVLLGPILNPGSAFVEIVAIVAASLGAAALTDRVLPWPRGPMLPAFVVIPALAVDAAAGTHLLIRSILGPNPSSGSRFFGIGNELKSGLTCLLLVGLAAAFGARGRSRRAAAIVAGAGVVLGVILGSARLGAGVGGVIIVAAGFATATLLMLPGRPSRLAIAIGVASPVLALAALALLDLLTAGGHGHFTHNVLHAGSRQSLLDIVRRRTTLAAHGVTRGAMPLLLVATASAVWFALRNRWLYRSVPQPMWRAAFIGGLVAGVVGAFSEDSGPVLLVVAIYTLVAATAYVVGAPEQRARATE